MLSYLIIGYLGVALLTLLAQNPTSVTAALVWPYDAVVKVISWFKKTPTTPVV